MAGVSDRWTEPDWKGAVDWCRRRNSQGIRCVVDSLGEYSVSDDAAILSVSEYLTSIKAISVLKLNASITVKLTALGALYDREKCKSHTLNILRNALEVGVGFEIDMEGKDLVQFTIETAVACAKEGGAVTLALQAYLDRTPEDLQVAVENGIKPRLVKGAYLGDTGDFTEIQNRFRRLVETIFNGKGKVVIGTHDPELVDWVKLKANANKRGVEFGFLKGLADRTKVELAKGGWAVSEYVPFGRNADAYDARRVRYLEELGKLGKAPVP